MADIFCIDCNKYTEVILDHTSGHTVCSECGRLLQSHSINESSDGHAMSDSSSTDTDMVRFGSPSNPLTPATVTTTTTINLPMDKKSRQLITASRTISNMADRLSLVSNIKDRANEIYKNLIERHHYYCRGRNLDTILAACLFVACQQEKLPRTLKEICSVTNNATTSRKDIGRAKSFIMQYLKDVDVDHANTNPSINVDNNISIATSRVARSSDFVERFCSNAGIIDKRATKAAFEAAVKLEEEMDVRRSPLSIAAAVVYIVSKLYEETSERVGYKDIAVATGVAQGTIKNSCKDLLPFVEKILPNWFASGDDFKVLSSNLC